MKEMIDDIQSMFDLVSGRAKKLFFSDDGPSHHFAAATLYGRILETAQSCIILLRAGDDTAIPIITRSLLDAFIDLAILAKNPEHENNILANELKEREKLYSRSLRSNGENEFLDALSKVDGLDKILAEIRKEKAELKEAGFEPLQAENRFEMAGFGDMYPSVFASLSEHVHNNLKVLKGRFLYSTVNGAKLRYSTKLADDEMIMYISTICDACVDGLVRLFIILGLEDDETLQSLDAALRAVRSHWQDSVVDAKEML